LPDLLRPNLSEAQIEQALAEGCARASEAILRGALEMGVPPRVDPAELMSSTVLIGYAHGDVLSLACLGDSRAYLVGLRDAEQLTVDGDVGCVHLAHGIPPEQVRDLGPDALALFSCLGVGERGVDGSLVRCAVRTQPQVTHWPMRPGHLVVLATDGLVEEGVYLDPADLTWLCRLYGPAGQRLSAALSGAPPEPMSALAERLVAAACDRHRDPSLGEPNGSGDDVTCVVLWAQQTGSEKPRAPRRPS
jgi:serine/threonine protein phosphatase PrpC